VIFVRYIASRLVHALPVLLGVTIFVFFAIQFVPGDPIRIMMHGRISDTEVAAIYARLGLDRPLLVQYLDFVRKAAAGDLGLSIIQNAPVTSLILEKLAPSLALIGMSVAVSVILSVPLALFSVFFRNRLPDHAIRIGSMIGFAMPPFWIGLLLILSLGVRLGWFPISGYGDSLGSHFHHLFLPSLTIALYLAPVLVQSLRSSMLDILAAEYIEVARAKGLSEGRILTKHVLRNAMIPAITVLAVNASWLVSGTVVVEYVFSLPGLGSLLVRSVGYRDYPLIQGLSLVFAVMVVIINLLADISYVLVDRRVLKA
jgi:peptide/nickel transport system permease protein